MPDLRPHAPNTTPDFVAGLDLLITEPLVLLPADRQRLATYAAEHMFPLIRQLGLEVWHKGKLCPPTIDAPGPAGSFYAHHNVSLELLCNGIFRASIQTPEKPEELFDGDTHLGTIATRLVVAHNDSMAAFFALEDGTTACKNDDPLGIPRLLRNTGDIFEPLPRRVYPAGNPALWLARLAQRNTLQTIQQQLAAIPAVR